LDKRFTLEFLGEDKNEPKWSTYFRFCRSNGI
jgi:hypothetical protein